MTVLRKELSAKLEEIQVLNGAMADSGPQSTKRKFVDDSEKPSDQLVERGSIADLKIHRLKSSQNDVYRLTLDQRPFLARPSLPDIEDLRSQLDAASKRQVIIQQTFREKTKEYRSLIQRLFGYTVDLLPDGTVRLTSCLKNISFRIEKDSFDILGEVPFRSEYEIYFQMGRSIFAFLSAVTLKIWEESTVALEGGCK